MITQLRRLSFLFVFFSLAFSAKAQWTQVTNLSGTQNYGGTNVTVTAIGGGAQSYTDWCGAGPYWIGASDIPGTFQYDFAPNVTGVMFEFTAMNMGEILTIEMNGQPYTLGPCNVSDFVGTCGLSNTVIVNGVVTCPQDVSSGANGTLTICGNISSITISNVGFGNGTVFSTYFRTAPCSLQGGGGTVTAGSNSPLCQGETLNLTATVGGNTYTWVGPGGFTSNQQNPTITNVTPAMAGDYIVESVGACGTALDTVTVQVTPGPVISGINSNSPVCEGGTLTFISGFINNGVYSWTGPDNFTSGLQSPSIPNVTLAAAGTYTLTVSVNNCVSDPATVNVVVDPLPPLPGVAPVNYCQNDVAVPLTATGNNLSWYLVPSGGAPLPGAPTPSTAMPGSTTYYVSSTGPGPTNCEGPRAPVVVTVYLHPLPPDIDYKNSYCANELFEPFTVVTGQNVQYYDSPIGGTVVTPFIDPTQPGTYQFFATQTVNNCESGRTPITIIVHPYIEANFTYSINWGCADDTVSFVNTSIGALNGYEWNFGDGSPVSAVANPVHVYADQGIYTVLLTSKAPYCTDTISQTFDLNHPLSASFTSDFDTICQNSSVNFTNTSVTTTINSIPPSYTWSFGDGSPLDPNMNSSHTYTNTGSYIVQMIVTDFVPCKDTAWKYVYVDSASMLSLVTSDSMFCAGQAATFTANYSDIGLMGVSWDYGDGYGDVNVNPARHTYEQQGIYTITFNTDYRICRDTSGTLQVSVKPHPIMNLGPDTSMCPTSGPLVLNDLINGGNANATWLWNTGESSFNIVVKQPGTYSAAVTIDGCTTSDSVAIIKDCYLDVPNSFTPDGDGLNDYFLPRQWLSKGVTKFKMSIYNRWGQEVYTTTQIDGRGWDGKLNDVPQPQGVFVYLIEVTFHNGMSEKKQGNVTLLR
jgi:gliding motility-associated-like protein